MEPTFIVLFIINLIAGFGFAFPLSRLLTGIKPARFRRQYAALIGIYFIESISISMGMGIPVFNIGMAFIWGIVFGLKLRECATAKKILKASFYLTLYTCLPAVSFISVPVMVLIGGENILSAADGSNFGIPDLVIWPLNTILGFYSAVIIGAVIFKTVITTGEVSLILHLSNKKKLTQHKS